jgi:hypothetical protein
MARDEAGRGLVLGFVGHGAEGVAQRVEVEPRPAVDAQFAE